MALYVVAYPRFAAADARWIEDLRRRHDPQAGRLGAHVTLVFAARGVAVAAAADHLRAVAAATPPFAVDFTEVALRRGHDGESCYAYLLPARGGDALRALHAALNQDPFARSEHLAFEPHVTLGSSAEPGALSGLVARCSAPPPDVRAEIAALHLLGVDGADLTDLASAPLGQASITGRP
ncbi:2'-5' RNA ligase family protein [Pelagibius sp. 7325]|uniref:2'-5' RNA ligase family protein n=1 Tax=Pelagibius sp. 7325 TaxID=3131994 RepID=UPI0030EB7E9F